MAIPKYIFEVKTRRAGTQHSFVLKRANRMTTLIPLTCAGVRFAPNEEERGSNRRQMGALVAVAVITFTLLLALINPIHRLPTASRKGLLDYCCTPASAGRGVGCARRYVAKTADVHRFLEGKRPPCLRCWTSR
jgi:hypothetical protein